MKDKLLGVKDSYTDSTIGRIMIKINELVDRVNILTTKHDEAYTVTNRQKMINFTIEDLRDYWSVKNSLCAEFDDTITKDYSNWLELQVVTLINSGLLVLTEGK